MENSKHGGGVDIGFVVVAFLAPRLVEEADERWKGWKEGGGIKVQCSDKR